MCLPFERTRDGIFVFVCVPQITATWKSNRGHTGTRGSCFARCAIVNAESLVRCRLILWKRSFGLSCWQRVVLLTRSRSGCSVVVVVLVAERETERKGKRFFGVNKSNRTEREREERDTRHELVQCVQQKAMVRPKSDEKPDTSSMRRSNIIQPCPVREVQIGANLTAIRCDLCSRGHNGIDRKEMPPVMSQHRWIDRKSHVILCVLTSECLG